MSTGPAIGIDLGTTFSCVGVFRDGVVEIIANDQGRRITPSYVAFTDKERLVGDAAKNQVATNPTNTVFDVKRLIGRGFNDEEVQADIRHWPFKVVSSGEVPMIEVRYCDKTRHFVAEQISAMVLMKMRAVAEAYLGEKVIDAVITVPAYFNVSQRQATIDAGKLAGLNVLRLINEPTAAAIAYGLDKKIDRQCNVLVFDWGGGTLDVSILSIENGKFEVKVVNGDTHLGGEDLTSRLVDHFAETFKKENKGKDLTTNKKALSRLRKACESAKRMLSSSENTTVDIESLFEDIDFIASISRVRFEQLCSDLFDRTLDTVKKALNDAKMDKTYVHRVLLVGGSTRIPKVQELLQDFFGDGRLSKSINPDEAVAYGAALLAASLAGSMSKDVLNLLLKKVTPLSLGVETVGCMMSTVVERNTQIPTKKTRLFETHLDHQTSALIKLEVLPWTLRGETKVGGTFEIDENGILHVSVVEPSTKKQNSITIVNYRGRLSEEEIERMLKEAENFKQEDEKERNRMEAINSLVDYVYNVRRKLETEEVKNRTSEEFRQNVLAMCEETIKWTDTERQASEEDCEQMRKMFENVESIIVGRKNSDCSASEDEQ
eukprot:TsM_000869600 transcript=TsM_000869600 gene=TsM_000869600